MHLLCKIKVVINIINIKTKTKGKNMQIQRKKGTQNPSTMPPDLKVEREENGRNEINSINDSIQNPHVCKYIDIMTQILQQNKLRNHIPEGVKKKKP
jgi:hypothetical protein